MLFCNIVLIIVNNNSYLHFLKAKIFFNDNVEIVRTKQDPFLLWKQNQRNQLGTYLGIWQVHMSVLEIGIYNSM